MDPDVRGKEEKLGVINGCCICVCVPHITYAVMYYVYLIKSVKYGVTYIGCTGNLPARLKQHNAGDSTFTKTYLPWRLIYFEGYRSKIDAEDRERSLKRHAQGLRRIKERLRDSLRA